MKIFWLSVKNVISRPMSTVLSLLLLALGVGIISLLLQLNRYLEDEMTKNIRGIDLVIGAKGSPLQLILSAVYHIDDPTGNISQKEANRILKNRMVDFGIPLSYGDNYAGYRIVGTTHEYTELYHATLAEGTLWNKTFEVTLGSRVAEVLNLKIGDTFSGSHGLMNSIEVHENDSYKVVGVLNPSNSVLDQLILTPTESVWETHHDEEEHHEGDEEKEITAMLIGFKNPAALIQVPRMINEKTNMQAAVPAYEMDRLYKLMGVSITVLKYIAAVIITVSGVSIFFSLISTLKERKYELAIMRTYGASRWQLLLMMLFEGLVLTIVGFLLGILISSVSLNFISLLLDSSFHYSFSTMQWTAQEYVLMVSTLGIGLIAALIPALNAFNLNISKTLSNA
ncbi:ABC transporter permease [Reichenbachiella versicolor]|uniref:ABC transporter permease n=1 Tax=Reichenbachiella versicolor TaxID=1821036 RepID=UPI000D6DD891|nr:FtsX-like permease family protein [Reichenbachiella versicolor]